MRALVSAIAFAGIVVSQVALAQINPTTSPSPRSAPVGHRQPTAADVEKAQTQKGSSSTTTAPQRSSDIDQRLIICRGC
jgi:hypothetical protein